MRPKAILISIFICVSLTSGQPAEENLDRTFQFIHTEKAQSLQEIGVGIRVIADIRQVSVDTAQRSLAVRGTAVQIGLAEWLWKELDQTAPPNPDSADHEYRLPAADDNLVRVFYLLRTQTVQDFQEAATLVRTIVEIRRVFTYNTARALVIRGTSDQISAAEWLIGQVRAPQSAQPSSAAREYRMAKAQVKGFDEDLVRVYFLPYTATRQDFQEAATLVRAITGIRRVFTYNSPRAMAVRGTDDQIALAEWLVQALDRPASAQPDPAPLQYRVSGSTDDVVRVFILTHSGSVQRVQEIAAEVRTATGVPRLFTYNAARVLTLRGTAGQIAQADRMIKQRDK